MTIDELRDLIHWADRAGDNATFWRRLWFAADAWDRRTAALIRGFVAAVGIVPAE